MNNKKLNLSAGFILASALIKKYKDIKIVDIKEQEEGYYVEFSSEETISSNDLLRIEKDCQKIVSSAAEIKVETLKSPDFKKEFKNNKFVFEDNKDKEVHNVININNNIVYTNDTDLLENTKLVKVNKLLNIGGSNWHNDVKKDQLVRIFGIAFETKDQLNDYLELVKERKERDHRKIGKELKLFTFDSLIGAGLPILLPNGNLIRNEIRNYIETLEKKYNFSSISTPVLASIELYKTSGHWDHYKENIFPPIKVDNEELVLRPMTCPHHVVVYKNEQYSYKQLPIRYCEPSILHRYESSGGLTGLERVRAMVLEDTHIFAREDQIKQEVKNCFEMIKQAHKDLGSKVFRVDLSLNDPNDKEKYHGNKEMWDSAQTQLEEMLNENNIEYTKMIGEAAFYGPKIDFQVKTALGRIITVSTIQLDFLLPERFDISYKDSNAELKRPVMIHLGLIGTFERYLAVLLEQTKGVLPLWLSPKQVSIIPVNLELHSDFCEEINQVLIENNIRTDIDLRNERISKKIRESQISKTPYQIVVGDDELKDKNFVSYREYGKEKINKVTIKDFVNLLKDKINSKN